MTLLSICSDKPTTYYHWELYFGGLSKAGWVHKRDRVSDCKRVTMST